MEVRVRVLQVRQDLPEAVQLGGHVHEAITLFLHNLDDLIREHLQILSEARSCRLDLPQIQILQIRPATLILPPGAIDIAIDQVCHAELLE